MAEDDGSFEAAKNHGMAHNHEVIDKIKSYAPADNTRVANPSGPNVDSRKERGYAKSNLDKNAEMQKSGENTSILGSLAEDLNYEHFRTQSDIADKKDAARNKVLKDTRLK